MVLVPWSFWRAVTMVSVDVTVPPAAVKPVSAVPRVRGSVKYRLPFSGTALVSSVARVWFPLRYWLVVPTGSGDCLLLKILQSAPESRPRAVADAVGRLRVREPPKGAGDVTETSVPVVPTVRPMVELARVVLVIVPAVISVLVMVDLVARAPRPRLVRAVVVLVRSERLLVGVR